MASTRSRSKASPASSSPAGFREATPFGECLQKMHPLSATWVATTPLERSSSASSADADETDSLPGLFTSVIYLVLFSTAAEVSALRLHGPRTEHSSYP